MTSATPKPRAGEQFRRTPDVIAQLEADNAALRERERALIEALRKIAGCQSFADGDVIDIARIALGKHGR